MREVRSNSGTVRTGASKSTAVPRSTKLAFDLEQPATALRADNLLLLQRAIGNNGVGWLLNQGAVQRAKGDIDPYAATDATAVKDSWAKGAYTDTETKDDLETQPYMQWRVKAQAAIATLHRSKKAAEKTRSTELADWVAHFEARQRWLLRNTPTPAPATGPAKLAAGEPADPGASPDELTTAAGALPDPSFRIVHEYDVTMPGGQSYSYRDDPIKRPYKYMTTETGIDHMGVPLARRTDLPTLFALAGITDEAEQKAIKKVSGKEAGFEGINTYDTGFVSVGMIQFTTGRDGDGTIIGLMKTAKKVDPAGYKTFFHDVGLDVGHKNGKDILFVVDPSTGTVLSGADAVQAVINDKRLSAVFQNAGEQWQNFRVAELKAALDNYWLADKPFTVTYDHDDEHGKKESVSLSGAIGDVMQSEAGKVALMDRAVQFGTGFAQKLFGRAAQKFGKQYRPHTVEELAKFEKWIILEVQNRIQVLDDKDLTQPPPPPIGDFPTTAPETGAVLVGTGDAAA